MDIQDLMGRVVNEIYAGLTGGSAELPLPSRMTINWVLPGVPFHESFFDFAIAGPYAGPSPATLDEFERLVKKLMGQPDPDDEQEEGGEQPAARLDRATAIEEAKRMHQQYLLGSWEQWSRLVDFIPLIDATEEQMAWSSARNQGSQGHKGVVYGQAGQTLSGIYKDTLTRCLVAEEPLTPEQERILERMRALLQVTVEKEDFLTGEIREEITDSPAVTIYNLKKTAYENAVIDYASRLARSQSGSAADLIEWSRSGGIYKRRALEALNDWKATGNREAIETARSAIAHITGGNMVQWKQNLLNAVEEIEENTMGAFGYSFFPATVLPGAFARGGGWTQYSQRNLSQRVKESSSSQSGGGAVGFSLGFFSIGGSGGASRREYEFSFESEDFGLEFEYTAVEICRPAFSPNFFLSRGWKPRDNFIVDHGPIHSDGKEKPDGCFIGYPTKALFVRNLKIYSTDVARFIRSKESEIHGGAVIGIGPFTIGGRYAQSNRESQRNFDYDTASVTVKGLQLIGFLSALFPATSNANPDVKTWI